MLGIVRLRRYRSQLLISLIAITVLFHFYSFGDTGSSFSVEKFGGEHTTTVPQSSSQYEQQPVVGAPDEAPIPPPAIPPIEKPTPRPEVPTKEDKSEPEPGDPADTPKPKPTETPEEKPADIPKLTSDKLPHQLAQQNRPYTTGDNAVLTMEHWVKSPEHFPVPEEQIFPLPKKYKELPQIQASFAKELGSKRKVRLERQKAIKDAMVHAWKGYRENAWLHDELLPVTGYYRDPFAGWGATLVDALDTLWIMGLEKEFLEAVEAVGQIDFTTTRMLKIPVFETVIRYLGGLIGAYDVSGGKHQILLDKAVELGDMLYGVFDTPNRMPLLHWGWRPGQTSRTFRGESAAVSAELGSLTVEFTRLAQITGNNTYFDAVQRITDALEEFQPKTNLPGMWPLNIDTSGCKVVQVPLKGLKGTTPSPDLLPQAGVLADGISGQNIGSASDPIVHTHEKRQAPEEPIDWLSAAQGHIMLEEDEPRQKKGSGFTVEAPIHPGLTKEAQGGKIHKEGEGKYDTIGLTQEAPSWNIHEEGVEKYDDIELTEESQSGKIHKEGEEKYDAIGKQLAIAATATVAEFVRTSPSCAPQGLTKPGFSREERFTLGGMADSLYEYLIKEYILLGGASDQYKKMYESSMEKAKKHLFFRPLAKGDPDVLLSGNVNVDNTGEITFDTDSGHLSCFTGGMLALGARALGHEADLDIGAKLTDGCVWAYASFESGIMPESFNTAYCKDPDNCKFSATEYYEQLVPKYRLPKGTGFEPHQHAKRVVPADTGLGDRNPATPVVNPDRVQKSRPTTLEGIAEQMIEEEVLPTGFTRVTDKRYILRPEAIESVFIMYRLTADTTWQDKGWRMWKSVDKATRTVFAFSAINDVARSPVDPIFAQLDEMESFWLAETLKYYYLLFSEPDLISLDDYVLNTEAHPLRRPRPSS